MLTILFYFRNFIRMKAMKREFSAGGVVFKKTGEQIVILIAQHSHHHGWVFPKGLIGDHKEGELKEETAVREVEEETGVLAKIIAPLSPVSYWYQWQKERRQKTVYYFLMEYSNEDLTKKDDEMKAVMWLPVTEVAKKLTYPSDKTVWQEAKNMLQLL